MIDPFWGWVLLWAGVGSFFGMIMGAFIAEETIRANPQVAAKFLAEAKMRQRFRDARRRIMAGEEDHVADAGSCATARDQKEEAAE